MNIDVILTASAAGFNSGLSRAGKAASGFKSVLGGVTSLVSSFGSTLAGVAGAGSITELVRQQFDHIDALAKTSDKLGIATEKLAGLRHAAELSGAGTDSMDKSLQRMIRSVSTAASKTDLVVGSIDDLQANSGAFAELGLDAEELSRLTPDKQFAKIADAMQDVDKHSDKVRLAFDIFGRDGVKLINTMHGGAAAIEGTIAEAEKLGIAVNRTDAAKIENANDAWYKFGQVLVGIAQTFAVELAPYIELFSNKMVEMGAEGEGAASQVAEGVGWIASTIAVAADVWEIFQIAFLKAQQVVTAGFGLLARKINGVIKGVQFLSSVIGVDLGKGGSEFLNSFIEDIDQKVEEMGKNIEDKWLGPSSGDKVRNFLDDVKTKADAAAQSIADAKTPTDALVESLDPEANGANKDKPFQVKVDPSKAYIDATRTPLEQFQAKISELNDVASAGIIDEDTFKRSVLAAKSELDSAVNTDQADLSAPDSTAALTRGSQGAFAAINRRFAGASKDPQEKSAKSLDDLVKLAKAQDERERQKAAAATDELATVSF